MHYNVLPMRTIVQHDKPYFTPTSGSNMQMSEIRILSFSVVYGAPVMCNHFWLFQITKQDVYNNGFNGLVFLEVSTHWRKTASVSEKTN